VADSKFHTYGGEGGIQKFYFAEVREQKKTRKKIIEISKLARASRKKKNWTIFSNF